jgi:hypothetical protein
MLEIAARLVLALSLASAVGCNARRTLAPSSDAAADASDGSRGSDGAPACLTGTVSFSFHAAAGSATSYCLGQPAACTGEWLYILAADGAESLSLVYGCVPDCSQCLPPSCPDICVTPSPLGAAGAHTSWDGTFVEHLTCGASIACTRPACAPAGHYIAHMCGYATPPGATPTCQGAASTPTCTDVPFTWPPPSGASSVEGVIGGDGTDAGAAD